MYKHITLISLVVFLLSACELAMDSPQMDVTGELADITLQEDRNSPLQDLQATAEDGADDLSNDLLPAPDGPAPDLSQPLCLSDAECDDGLPCTVDSCDPATGCSNPPDDALCDDGIPCTVDSCDPATGCKNVPDDTLCAPPGPCVDVVCDPALGCLEEALLGPCNDGDNCTQGDFCLAGECVGATVSLTANCLYDQAPSVASCSPGSSSAAATEVARSRVNTLRALSGLPPVAYDFPNNVQTQAAALMMVANGTLNHTPPQTWYCWSQTGYDGSSTSNLHLSYSTNVELPDPISAVDAFLIDNNVESLGHRRWLLSPFLKKVSYGAVHGKAKVSTPYPNLTSAALKVIYSGGGATSFQGEYVAYPLGDYPAELFQQGWYLSFSMVPDKSSSNANSQVNLANVSIAVAKPGGGAMVVHSVQSSNEYYGVPNHVQWKVNGLQNNVNYTVSVSGLVYKGQNHSYQYDFKLVP